MPECDPTRIDETLHELTVHCTQQYPFRRYHCHYGSTLDKGFPWHWHRELKWCWLRLGISLSDRQRSAHAFPWRGSFIQSGVLHSYEAPQAADMLTILFMPEFVAPEGSTIHDRLIAPFLETNLSHVALGQDVRWQSEVLKELGALHALLDNCGQAWELDAHIAVCTLWANLYRHQDQIARLGKAASSTLLQFRLKKMIACIETQFSGRLRLEDIARDASISVSEALRCFRDSVHTTPIVYLNQFRLNYARSRLLTTTLSVTEIAAESGFSSAAYFDRMFRRVYGQSPTACRKRRAGKPPSGRMTPFGNACCEAICAQVF